MQHIHLSAGFVVTEIDAFHMEGRFFQNFSKFFQIDWIIQSPINPD